MECSRLQKLVCHLVLEQAGLELDVGTVVIRQAMPPVERAGVITPAKDLLRRHRAGIRPVGHSGIGMRTVEAHERFRAAVGECFKVALLLGDQAQVYSLRIDGPCINVIGAVVLGELHRIVQSGVRPDFDARIVPPEKMVARIAMVGQSDALFYESRAWVKNNLDRPIHAVDAVSISNGDRSAPVGRGAVSPIYRRYGYPVMRHGKIELFAESGPRATIGDDCLLE